MNMEQREMMPYADTSPLENIVRTRLIELAIASDTDPFWRKLRTPGIRYVPGIGHYHPSVMLIGEAPGAQENTKGEPFVGPAGRVLRELMASAGLSVSPQWSDGNEKYPETIGEIPANSYLTNVLKYRPPGNRNPTYMEIRHAKPYLRSEWRIIGKPKIIVAIGAIAWNAMGPPKPGGILLNAPKPVRKGKVIIVPMIHPAFALRNESARPTCEKHWEQFGRWLEQKGIVGDE